jgi:hypothetical protein
MRLCFDCEEGMTRSTVFFLLLVSIAAHADALRARNGREVRVMVAQKPRRAIEVTPSAPGWRLEVDARGAAEVFDVTPGTPARTFSLPVSAGALLFDRNRFAGGHVYRVQLRAGDSSTSGFVYLRPDPPTKDAPRRPREVTRLRFDTEEKAPPPSKDVILPVQKGPL